MKKLKGRGGPPKKPLNPTPELAPDPPRRISDVPPELWSIIASSLSRQSLAQLCAVSRRFYSMFSRHLYGNIIDPLLTPVQSTHLMKTLSDAQTPDWRPHSATLIRQLGVTSTCRLWNPASTIPIPAASLGLRNLYALIPPSERARGSLLRVLHWHLEASLDDLGRILGVPGHFPNLKELDVSSTGINKNFNFMQIRGLEVLGIKFTLSGQLTDEDNGNRLCYKLAETIQMLPMSSPLLHTLRLNIIIPYNDEEIFPWEGYDDLVASINLIHLPVLAALELSVNLYQDDGDYPAVDHSPSPDLSPFLSSHPNLLDLSLSVADMKLPEEISFLPRLRSFKGSFEQSAVICARQRQLEKLVIEMTHPGFSFDFPTFHTVPLPTHLSLTILRILAADSDGQVVKARNEISPASFSQLAVSVPNLKNLDICLSRNITEYRTDLIRLTKLQTLRVEEYRINRYKSSRWAVTEIFPPKDYISEFGLFLPFLPQLASIEISLFADNLDWEEDSWSYPEVELQPTGWQDVLFDDSTYEMLLFERPCMKVDYRFSVVRPSSGAYAVLDNARVFDRKDIG
ncbi:hypothetical protein DFH09DRAFT_1359026 [Mycena vulgaris]|nr:hypothetical protein DFH09DRAFT_1359026 [Mycena vulgaris]